MIRASCENFTVKSMLGFAIPVCSPLTTPHSIPCFSHACRSLAFNLCKTSLPSNYPRQCRFQPRASAASAEIPRTALLLVDHGSRREAANALLEEVAMLVQTRVPKHVSVVTAHMSLATPTITESFARCVKRGAKHVIVVPFFLVPGKHATEDIPRMVQKAAEEWKGITWEVGDILGADPKLIDIIVGRAEQAKEFKYSP